MFPAIGRVYANDKARRELGWRPEYDFRRIIDRLVAGKGVTTPLAQIVGAKGYHTRVFADGPFPVE